MEADIQTTPFVKQLADSGMYLDIRSAIAAFRQKRKKIIEERKRKVPLRGY